MASISCALARIKRDLRTYLPDRIIEQVCRDAGHRYRRRELEPPILLHLFVLQVLCFRSEKGDKAKKGKRKRGHH